MKKIFIGVLAGFLLNNMQANDMVVGVPVLDVRIEPLKDFSSFKPMYPMLSYVSGNLDSQLLYGDKVRILKEKDEWAYVETQQKMCDKINTSKLKNIGGYVLRKYLIDQSQNYQPNATIIKAWSAVHKEPKENSSVINKFSYGTKLYLKHLDNSEWAKVIMLDGTEGYIKEDLILLITDAKKMSEKDRMIFVQTTINEFLGHPYVWGGVSAHDPENKDQTTGNDCSGLAYLMYNRALCIKDFPRNSGDQYLSATKKIENGQDLQPADLIFLGKKREDGSTRISHIMIYLGNGEIAESVAFGFDRIPENLEEAKKLCVRKVALKDISDTALKDMTSGKEYQINGVSKIVLFGRYV